MHRQLDFFGSVPSLKADSSLAYTWDDAVNRWVIEQSHKASLNTDRMHFRWLHPFFSGLLLSAIDRQKVEEIRQAKIDSGVSNATVNRVLSLIRSVLRRACNDWEWLIRVPYFRLLPEPTRRVRFLSRVEAVQLLHELPVHLSDMAAFTLSTGLRRANVTGLLWSQVCLLYTSPSPRDQRGSRMPSSA